MKYLNTLAFSFDKALYCADRTPPPQLGSYDPPLLSVTIWIILSPLQTNSGIQINTNTAFWYREVLERTPSCAFIVNTWRLTLVLIAYPLRLVCKRANESLLSLATDLLCKYFSSQVIETLSSQTEIADIEGFISTNGLYRVIRLHFIHGPNRFVLLVYTHCI